VIINLFIIVGVLALMNGTLTLPGIAGFVLTIGTAVDANVLINERIREERRKGRSVVMAVERLQGSEPHDLRGERDPRHRRLDHAADGLRADQGLRGGAADRHRHLGVHRGRLHPHAGRALDPREAAHRNPYLRPVRCACSS
jgi:hypothetical protein